MIHGRLLLLLNLTAVLLLLCDYCRFQPLGSVFAVDAKTSLASSSSLSFVTTKKIAVERIQKRNAVVVVVVVPHQRSITATSTSTSTSSNVCFVRDQKRYVHLFSMKPRMQNNLLSLSQLQQPIVVKKLQHQQFLSSSSVVLKATSTRKTDVNLNVPPPQPSSSSSSSSSSMTISPTSQLAQLASMTTLSIDSGDLDIIQSYASTGYITDVTTNPLFVSQAGLNSNKNPIYTEMVNDAVQYAIRKMNSKNDSTSTDDASSSSSSSSSRSSSSADGSNTKLISSAVSIAIDRLAVNLGASISKIVSGYVSTEVDPRLSFNTKATVDRALQIIAMYNEMGIPKERILIKIAATWEGIMAASILEREYSIQCNLTLIFSVVQAIACAQYGIHLISPFPGRILDWYKQKLGRTTQLDSPNVDEGVIACRDMYNYYKVHNHNTICMPASWRPSRGPGYELDEILALAGTDRMTIPAQLLHQLATSEDPIERRLSPVVANTVASMYPLIDNGCMTEEQFRYRLNMDGCGTDKLAEGIRAFIGETEKLEAVLTTKIVEALSSAEA